MLIDDLHFKIDNRAVIQGNFNVTESDPEAGTER